jgi:hypothetical protein
MTRRSVNYNPMNISKVMMTLKVTFITCRRHKKVLILRHIF